MSIRGKRRLASEINVVPYIDVMLVLLVIFMITAPLLTQGIHVNLPQAHSHSIVEPNTMPMIVSINAQGQYFLNTNEQPSIAMPLSRLMVSVAAQHRIQPKRPLLIKGDQSVSYAAVMHLMASLQQAGVQEIGMLTEPESKA